MVGRYQSLPNDKVRNDFCGPNVLLLGVQQNQENQIKKRLHSVHFTSLFPEFPLQLNYWIYYTGLLAGFLVTKWSMHCSTLKYTFTIHHDV
jgi:hypothetical protein